MGTTETSSKECLEKCRRLIHRIGEEEEETKQAIQGEIYQEYRDLLLREVAALEKIRDYLRCYPA